MKNDNDSIVSLAQALQDMKTEQGESFDLAKVNLAELERRCGISRAKLRRLKSNNFKETPHALTGRKALKTVMTGYEKVKRVSASITPLQNVAFLALYITFFQKTTQIATVNFS
ncbi:hypothetical protein [Treponema ruminis]|uniref:Uncharacterized protein n=1 Tax=Treponema ruminis TaxID=744515 RepID=A0A7W8LMR7_9SPIR|nr:hypothetical protein [Treponema ruminis]MBB5226861.1 hypothetical protein [Treponema ruminis]